MQSFQRFQIDFDCNSNQQNGITYSGKTASYGLGLQSFGSRNFAILDTETTGLGSTSEIVQIAAIDASGVTLIDELVKPTVPIEPAAQQIHGINQQMTANAQSFDLVFLDLLKAIGNKELVIYNAAYDTRLIQQSLAAHGVSLHLHGKTWVNGRRTWCAMLAYSQWVGEWNDRRGSYRWQKLPGGDHSAVGDCRATLDVIRKMSLPHR